MHSHCLTFLRTLSTAADETNNIWMCFQHFHHLKLLRIDCVNGVDDDEDSDDDADADDDDVADDDDGGRW